MTAYLVSEDSSDIISETEYNQHKSIKVLKNKIKRPWEWQILYAEKYTSALTIIETLG